MIPVLLGLSFALLCFVLWLTLRIANAIIEAVVFTYFDIKRARQRRRRNSP